jgi:hypothetical protein
MVALTSALLAGCRLGTDRLLMITGTTVGMHAQAVPPTAELGASRIEGVIAPRPTTGPAPPVFAAFNHRARSPASSTAGAPAVGSVLATGRAAVWLTDPAAPIRAEGSAQACPDGHSPSRPLLFVADTATGLKLAWTGAAGWFPDRLSLGYSRHEAATVPMPPGARRDPDSGTPSVIAAVDVAVAGQPGELFNQRQFFATGRAAEAIARDPAFRALVFRRLVPQPDSPDTTRGHNNPKGTKEP